MNDKQDFKMLIAEAAIKCLDGCDFHLVMDTLSRATSDRVYSFLKDCVVDDEAGARHVASEVLHITDVMAFLSELYHWNTLLGKYPND